MIETALYGSLIISIACILIFAFFLRKYRTLGLSISFVVYGVLSLGTIFSLMGKPVPQNIITSFILHQQGEFEIIWYSYAEGKGIWALVQNGVNAPIYLVLPWDPKKAQEMDEAKRKQKQMLEERNGDRVRMLLEDPFGEQKIKQQTIYAERLKKPL